MKTIQEVRDRRDEVKEHDDYWTAKCPAHEDNHPSLSIKSGREGRILLKCHTGCPLSDIAGSIGFKVHELLPDREPGTNGHHPPGSETTYDYTDASGNLLYQVVRKPGGKFLQRRPDGAGDWIWNLKGVP